MNSVTQRSPVPTIRRTVKRLEFGWATREACMLCRPLMRSPDCGYSSSASSRYMSCSTSKSFTSEAAQWRLSASRISFSSILLLPFLWAVIAILRLHRAYGHRSERGNAIGRRCDRRRGGLRVFRQLRAHRAGGGNDSLRRDYHRNRAGWATTRTTAGGYGNESCHHRTRTLRRHLRQYRLYTHENAGRERLRRPPRAPRSRLRIQHRGHQGRYEACQSAQGLRRWPFQPRRRAISQKPGKRPGL